MLNNISNNGGAIGKVIRAKPVYVGGTTSAGEGTEAGGPISLTSLSGGVGTSPEEGDVIIIAYAIGSTSDINVDVSIDEGSVTELVDLYSNDSVDANLGVYYSVVGATPPTTVTPGNTGSSLFAGAIAIHVWRNIDAENPIDVTTTTATLQNSALANPPSITTVTENAVVLAIGASGNDNNNSPFQQGGGAYNFVSIGGADTEDATVGIGAIFTTSPTTVDPTAFSIADSSSFSAAAATVALRPKLISVPINNVANTSIYSNGGVIGTNLDITSIDQYLIGGNIAPQYVGGYSIGFAGTTSNTDITLTSLSGGLASSPAENDLVIVCFAVNPDDTGPISYRISGYTEAVNISNNDTEQTQLQVGYKVMTSTPDTSVTITGGTGDIDQAGAVAVHVWRYVDTATPLDVTASTTSVGNTVLVNPPSITPVTKNAVVLGIGAGGHSRGTDSFQSSFLSNFVSVGGNDTHDITVGVGSLENWFSDSVDPPAFMFDEADSSGFGTCGATIALRPNAVLGNQKNSGIWNLSSTRNAKTTYPIEVEYLVVGGGASGGNRNGGGGGAGGYLSGITTVLSTTYTVTVGAGGADETVLDADGNNGSSSRFGSFIADGGGGGGADNGDFSGRPGGSGGGGRGYRSGAGGSGVVGEGNDGGSGIGIVGVYGSGGGGGAAAFGQDGSGTKGGDGGAGIQWIDGRYYAGGGGGASEGGATTYGLGGIGGGGSGGTGSTAALSGGGEQNTGGGGGGGGLVTTVGLQGGSGVVVLKYLSRYNITIGAGLSGHTIKQGDYKITTIRSGTGNVSWT